MEYSPRPSLYSKILERCVCWNEGPQVGVGGVLQGKQRVEERQKQGLTDTHRNQSTAMISVMSSVGRPTDVSTMTIVTRPAWGMPAAPTLAAVAVILQMERKRTQRGRRRKGEKRKRVRKGTTEGKGQFPRAP